METQHRAGRHAAKASAKMNIFRQLYLLCARVGLGTSQAAVFLGRGLWAGMGRIRRLYRPAGTGKKGLALTLLNYGGPVVTAAALVMTILFWSGRSFGIAVEYEGQTLGYISSEETYDLAAARINDRLAVRTGESILPQPTFSLTLLGNRQVMDETQLADALVAQSTQISEAYGLFLNDTLLTTAAQGETLRAALDDYLEDYRSEDENERAAFVGDLTIEEGLYPTDLINTDTEARADIAAGGTDEAKLQVMVIREETYEEAIPFSTVEIPDETRLEDYRETVTAGADGVAQVTAQVTYVDGQETGRQVLSSQVLVEPVSQEDVVGTMTMSQYEEQQALAAARMEAGTYTLEWPVGASCYVSSYMGDGRGHKGYDIAAAAGSPILAAESGRVVSVNASGSAYGLHFVIDHGNGLQTLYAHCSSIDVEVGQQVTRGEEIAKVGRTGRATGNHLHFEVWKDGYIVNPGDYL